MVLPTSLSRAGFKAFASVSKDNITEAPTRLSVKPHRAHSHTMVGIRSLESGGLLKGPGRIPMEPSLDQRDTRLDPKGFHWDQSEQACVCAQTLVLPKIECP